MAELLSIHVHFPERNDTADKGLLESGLKRNTSFLDQPKYDLPKKRNLDIEFRDLRYTVKDANNKGIIYFNYDVLISV